LLNELLTPPVQDFIRAHEQDDERLLVLKHRHVHGVPASKIAEQIAGRRKAREKLPTYYQTASILYPPGLNLEQSSSEQTARYKADILREVLNVTGREKLVDLTGGFGIDTFFFSKLFKHVAYVEPDTDLLDLARHNHAALQAHNISYHSLPAKDFLDTLREPADCIYIDPSRRKGSQKVFRLAECEPDVTVLQQQIFEHAQYLLIKTSPLFDIQQGLRELHAVKKVFVVSVGNECKELLFLCEQNFTGEATITAVNLNTEHREDFTFTVPQEKESALTFSPPLKFIFEPNASLLKAGAFRIVASRFALAKIHSSTHLYTSDHLLEDFPGRIFKVEVILKSDPKIIAQYFPDGKANVITRNYPLSVDALKKKMKLNDGGDNYLLAFTAPGEKFLCKASRIK
jgi:16S rRNA G966 N2-methylase RsmD